MIPDEAVEAAFGAYVGGNEVTGPDIAGDFLTREQLRTILEAAAPHLLRAAADAIVANCPLDECRPAVELLRKATL